jgi:hypothetical protein
MTEVRKDDIVEGTLRCSQCSSIYPIKEGLAFLNPDHPVPSQAQKRYEILPVL